MIRADTRLVELGLVPSRNRAQAEIKAGRVRASGRAIEKPSEQVSADAPLTLEVPENPWVSRGGLKLEFALAQFGFDVAGCVALDIGASTGGFTQVLLARGAKRVYAVDVGRAQLHSDLRRDKRVVNLEGQDARQLNEELVPEEVDILVADVSFISLKLVLPVPMHHLNRRARIVLLVKPQFECGPKASKKGVVRDANARIGAYSDLNDFISAMPEWQVLPMLKCPVPGGKGNVEMLLGAIRR